MLSRRNPQLNKHGELVHLLSIEGLPQAVIHQILDTAGTFLSVNDREVKKVPLLRGKSVFNLFKGFMVGHFPYTFSFAFTRARSCLALAGRNI